MRTDTGIAAQQYVDHLTASIGTTADHRPLEGLRIAVDAANGAASQIGPEALRAAGADVVVINASPDGRNINEKAGSTHPEQLQAVVVAAEADFGVAFDGDADRCLAVDHGGVLVDGDQILGILAKALKDEGRLTGDTLVVTVMSNLGLLLAMKKAGIATLQTGVGDRYVLEAMRAGGHSLGGEQSGHLIFLDRATTGDGLLTGLRLLSVVARSGRPLSELATVMRRLPQVLVNVRVADRAALEGAAGVWRVVAAEEARLGDRGRVLVRPSGTEALVRVMVEAETEAEARDTAERLAGLVAAELG
jgi:phosphoglucosamine mutase